MGKRIDLTGQKYGNITPLYRVEDDKYGRSAWMCKCDCGTQKVISANALRNESARSCGCLEQENRMKFGTRSVRKHLATKTRLYKIWQCSKLGALIKTTNIGTIMEGEAYECATNGLNRLRRFRNGHLEMDIPMN